MFSPADPSRAILPTLADLCDGLLQPGDMGPCHIVESREIPDPFHRLLVHHEHMTSTLAAHYGRPMTLHVLARQHVDSDYARLITLSPERSPRAVEVGLVRIHLDSTPPPVRDMILEEKTPLGDILIRENVLRRIEPQAFLCFQPGPLLIAHFGQDTTRAYGRIGVIHCDAKPAIRLLEIVSGK